MTAGRLDGQAFLGAIEDQTNRFGSGRPSKQKIHEPLLTRSNLARVVEREFEPPRAHRLGQATGDGGSTRPDLESLRTGQVRLVDHLGLADLVPASGVDRLEPVLDDQGLAGPLRESDRARAGHQDGGSSRTVFEPDRLGIHRSEPSRDPLVESKQDPDRR